MVVFLHAYENEVWLTSKFVINVNAVACIVCADQCLSGLAANHSAYLCSTLCFMMCIYLSFFFFFSNAFSLYSQHQYLGNINAFLTACRKNFTIPESELFKDLELYDVANFSKVRVSLQC